MRITIDDESLSIMIAAALCVLLFSGRLAAAEKTFTVGGYGGETAAAEKPPVVKAVYPTVGSDASGSTSTWQAPETSWSYGGQWGYSSGGASSTPAVAGGAGAKAVYPTTGSDASASTTRAPETSWSFGGQWGISGGISSTPASSGGEPSAAAAAAAASTNNKAGGYGSGSPSTPASGGQASTTNGRAAGAGGYGSGKGLDAAGEPEVGMSQKAIDDIVREHNVFRAKEHVPPLKWNATLAKFAQDYAEKLKGECKMVHSSSPYGENLMWATGGITWKTTIDAWSEEKKNYHYGSNTCDAGQMCGHYTAVVWKDTTTVGCGRVKCNNGEEMEACSYWPPGNYDGEKPY